MGDRGHTSGRTCGRWPLVRCPTSRMLYTGAAFSLNAGAGQQVDRVLDGLHGVFMASWQIVGASLRWGKLFNFAAGRPALHLMLLHLCAWSVRSRQPVTVNQTLPSLAEDLAGAASYQFPAGGVGLLKQTPGAAVSRSETEKLRHQ